MINDTKGIVVHGHRDSIFKENTIQQCTCTVSIIMAISIKALARSLFRILCKYLFSEVAVQAVTELDNKAAHCHTPVPQWHRPFL